MQETTKVELDGAGNVSGLQHEIKTNTLSVRQFARMLKEAKKTNPNFAGQCRVVGVIPHYLPDGVFTPDKCAMNLDPDQVDFLLKTCPDFDTDLKTGRTK